MKVVKGIGSVASSMFQSSEVYGPPAPSQQSSDIDFGSVFSTGLTLAGSASRYYGARQQANAMLQSAGMEAQSLRLQATDMDLEAQRETLRGKQEANVLMDELRQTISAQRLAAAANGVDFSFGTPVSVNEQARGMNERQMSVLQADTMTKVLARRKQGASLSMEAANIQTRAKSEAKITKRSGAVEALGGIAELVQRRIDRG